MHNAAEAGNLEAITTLLVRSNAPFSTSILIKFSPLSQIPTVSTYAAGVGR